MGWWGGGVVGWWGGGVAGVFEGSLPVCVVSGLGAKSIAVFCWFHCKPQKHHANSKIDEPTITSEVLGLTQAPVTGCPSFTRDAGPGERAEVGAGAGGGRRAAGLAGEIAVDFGIWKWVPGPSD